MRLAMKLPCLILVCCTLPLLQSGCSDSPRREALGGGALTPVKVTVLREAPAGSAATGAAGAAATTAKIDKFGTFKGKVVVTGMAPQLPPLVAQGQQVKDAICSKVAVPNETAVVGAGNGLANVFVFLAKVPNVDVPPAPSDPVVIDQHGCKFVPHASIIRVGQPLKMLNSDPVAHNVKLVGFAMSFNQTLPAGDKTGIEIKYQRAERGPIPLSCDFHGWMQAQQLAVDHPWAALTREDGTFEIAGVPAGKMEFVVHHEKLGAIERKLVVEVPADGVVEKTIEVNAAGLAPQ
jgi:plastocyanin